MQIRITFENDPMVFTYDTTSKKLDITQNLGIMQITPDEKMLKEKYIMGMKVLVNNELPAFIDFLKGMINMINFSSNNESEEKCKP